MRVARKTERTIALLAYFGEGGFDIGFGEDAAEMRPPVNDALQNVLAERALIVPRLPVPTHFGLDIAGIRDWLGGKFVVS